MCNFKDSYTEAPAYSCHALQFSPPIGSKLSKSRMIQTKIARIMVQKTRIIVQYECCKGHLEVKLEVKFSSLPWSLNQSSNPTPSLICNKISFLIASKEAPQLTEYSGLGISNPDNGSITQSPPICSIFEFQNRGTIKRAPLYMCRCF